VKEKLWKNYDKFPFACKNYHHAKQELLNEGDLEFSFLFCEIRTVAVPASPL
jgi:hypothetical protein